MLSRKGIISIKKQPLTEWLAYFIFLMPFFISLCQDLLGLPGFVRYLIDAAWVTAAVLLFFKRSIEINRKLVPVIILLSVFFVYTIMNYAFNHQSILFYLWGFRNNFRFYFAFLIFCLVFTEENVDFCLKFIDVAFWINAVVTFFQFFVLGYQQDFLGGIFGVDKGCNASSIVFFSIVLSKSLILYMSNKESVWLCFSKIAITLMISALAELKFFFVVFMIILVLSTLLTSFAWKKVIILLLSAALIAFSSSILTVIFGEGSNISFEKLLELATSDNYSSANDLGRLTGIPTVSRTLFTDWADRLFGFGLGNCDTSTFDVFNTPFYQNYGFLHYTWFSAVFMFLELGVVGLTLYILFFVFCFVGAFLLLRKNGNQLYCQMAMIMAVLSLVIVLYNSSMRTEVGYIFYFVLALPFIPKNRTETA